MGLVVAAKPDSQDICFVPTGRYTNIIDRLRPGASGEGDIVHLDGRVLGRHKGIIHYTIGQRKGLGLGASEPDAQPLFVVKLDAAARRVIVGPKSALLTHCLTLRDVNWLGDMPVESLDGMGIMARVRSTAAPVAARLHFREGRGVEVDLPEGEEGVAPGQACVFYAPDGTRVLGGGFIAMAHLETDGAGKASLASHAAQ
jgi:tRNA-specific 2-thiouridylase